MYRVVIEPHEDVQPISGVGLTPWEALTRCIDHIATDWDDDAIMDLAETFAEAIVHMRSDGVRTSGVGRYIEMDSSNNYMLTLDFIDVDESMLDVLS